MWWLECYTLHQYTLNIISTNPCSSLNMDECITKYTTALPTKREYLSLWVTRSYPRNLLSSVTQAPHDTFEVTQEDSKSMISRTQLLCWRTSVHSYHQLPSITQRSNIFKRIPCYGSVEPSWQAMPRQLGPDGHSRSKLFDLWGIDGTKTVSTNRLLACSPSQRNRRLTERPFGEQQMTMSTRHTT